MKKLVRRLSAAVCILALCLNSAGALSVEDAINLLDTYYVDPLPAAVYEAETLDDVFASLGDQNTYYMDAADYQEFTRQIESESSVTGVGASIEYTADGIHLTSILPGGGAEEAGLQAGDYVIAIDGISCVPAAEQHRSLIVGEEGTTVTLTIRHADDTVEDYSIVRRVVAIHNTNVTYTDGIGYIDCNSFGSKTPEYFDEALSQHEDAELWQVDLRNNIGGIAESAVSILGSFTGPGPKLYYRLGDGETYFTFSNDEQKTDKPVIVLVNGWSASSSEILAGGIGALNAGIIVGSRTYGKGTAQIVLDKDSNPELFGGDSLKITVYRFYGPNGNTPDRIGIIPTLYVSDELTESVSSLLKVNKPDSSEYLALELNGNLFYIDPKAAESADAATALGELLSALPPDTGLSRIAEQETSLLTASEALAMYSDPALFRGFNDVSSSPYATEINTLATYGIVPNDSADGFYPERALTRAELCGLLAQTLNVTSRGISLFSDVPEDHPYFGDINAIARLGFMNGIGDGLFDPDSTLTYEQLITVIGRFASFLNLDAASYYDNARFAMQEESSEETAFSSSYGAFASWARTSASVLDTLSAVNADDDGARLWSELSQIDPRTQVTREQAAATICHLLKTLNIISY